MRPPPNASREGFGGGITKIDFTYGLNHFVPISETGFGKVIFRFQMEQFCRLWPVPFESR